MELAVQSGYWPLYRFDPRRFKTGEKPLKIDSKPPTISLTDYLMTENRFAMVQRRDPERFEKLVAEAEYNLRKRHAVYEKMAELCLPTEEEGENEGNDKGEDKTAS
jgi:pyruvate-ferredoxin/flavodoxin oxidoreductase